ncbi:MAG TPA: L,D-transpeptidase family protein [Allosphingosinicella sp.]|nr:L,D-transpeptidase family protein [Allosphingosinicella sp.]
MRLGLLASAAFLVLAACSAEPAPPPGPQAPQVEASALQGAVDDPRVRRFYEARQWRPAWTREAEASLNAVLGEADKHGLKADEYRAPLARAREGAAREAALSLAAIAYAEALARGKTDPARLERIYEIPRPNPDLAAGLERVLAGNGDVRGWIAGLAPQDADYRALSAAYLDAKRQVDAAQGRATAEQSNRMRVLAVNLERRRWLERAAPATRIDVNTAATTLVYWRDNAVRDTRRVVVGSAGQRATPSLSSPMFQLVANPTWTVPRSIGMSAGYMARRGFTIRNGRRVQPSGPGNALGLVKFDMRNGHAIYLHDTPSKSLFLRDERHASHGCVRVHNALEFAELIARDEGVLQQWQRAQRAPTVRRTNAEGETVEQPAARRYVQRWIPLQREIPVRLLYHTAFVENGQVRVVRDVYQRDDRVAAALGLPARARPAPRAAGGETPADVGP